MFPTVDELELRLSNLSESFSVEVKRWIDPATPEGKAKIVKACIALRNNNGGIFVIGFEDGSMEPSIEGRPVDIRVSFGQDDIQALIARFASDPFEVLVQYVLHEGHDYPVICVPAGAKFPVAAKAEIKDQNQKLLVHMHAVYVRTLGANNTVSTAPVPYKDWPSLIDRFLDNREADIGRFVRRHLDGSTLGSLASLLQGNATPVAPDYQELSRTWLDQGEAAFNRMLNRLEIQRPGVGTFEAAMLIDGDVKDLIANRDFLNLISSSSRHLTGWPFFGVLTSAREPSWNAAHIDNAWEQAVIRQDRTDFWRIQPDGKLYALHGLDEDYRHEDGPNRVVSITTAIYRVGDVIAEALAIAKQMVIDPSTANLHVSLRWTGLKGRALVTWGTDRYWSLAGMVQSQDNIAVSYLSIPLDVPDSALAQHIYRVLIPLYLKFEGFEIGQRVVEEEIARLLSGRL